MNKYKIVKTLGEGSFGSVFEAQNLKTKEKVAIKKMKQDYQSWKDCLHLRELMSLKVLRHGNIVRLKEMVLENKKLNFIFEFCDHDLYKEIKNGLKPEQISSYTRQMLNAMSYMHKHGYFHRDMKPENVLIADGRIKIADFGLAREVRSRPPYTEYVSTRWYRSPELLLRSPTYNSPVDVWAIGAIIVEMFTGKALFAGDSEVDMLMKIFTAFGPPAKSTWENGVKLCRTRGITTFPEVTLGLTAVIEKLEGKLKIPPAALDLASKCMILNPLKRCTAHSGRKHPFCQLSKSHSTVAAAMSEEPLLCTTVKPSPTAAAASASSLSNLESTLDIDEMLKMIGEVEKSHEEKDAAKSAEPSGK